MRTKWVDKNRRAGRTISLLGIEVPELTSSGVVTEVVVEEFSR
jgi:hypothetical protein